jgi:hypothetical protein
MDVILETNATESKQPVADSEGKRDRVHDWVTANEPEVPAKGCNRSQLTRRND